MKGFARGIYRYLMRRAALRANVRASPDLNVGRGSILMAPDSLIIEERVKIGIHTSILVNGVIEDGVQISSYVAIVGKHDHDMKRLGQRPHNAPWIFDPEFPARDDRHAVYLERDVWIGWGALVLSGVRVGRGAVIAAGAVVTRDVPPYAIMAGNPAKQVSSLFGEEEILAHEKLLEMQ